MAGNAGRADRRITFYSKTQVVSDSGSRADTFAPASVGASGQVWAQIVSDGSNAAMETGREGTLAQMRESTNKLKFKVRWESGFDVEMRIIDDLGDTYEIVHIQRLGRNERLMITGELLQQT